MSIVIRDCRGNVMYYALNEEYAKGMFYDVSDDGLRRFRFVTAIEGLYE